MPTTGELAIGRGATCQLVVNHASVSRRHATLRLSPLEIIDEGSRNGTHVRGARIPTAVEVGDVVQLGDTALVLQAVPVSESPPLAEPPPGSPIDVEIARSARTRSPFALLQVATPGARATDVLPLLRAIMRTTDVIRQCRSVSEVAGIGAVMRSRRITAEDAEERSTRRAEGVLHRCCRTAQPLLGALRPSAPSAVTLEHASSGSRAA